MSLRLCPRCGVVAPLRSSRCAVCDLPLGTNTLQAPQPPVGSVWVSIWCWLSCGSCKATVPVDRFDDDRAVCPACGISTWFLEARRVFDYAHAVADLAGPDPEGRFGDATTSIADVNPFKSVGVTQTTSEERHHEARTERSQHHGALSLRAAPGHPLCDECHRPLGVHIERPGMLVAHCEGCNRRFTASIGEHHMAMLGAVRGVLSIAHRDDRPTAAIELGDDGSVTGVRCPDCTASVAVVPQRRTVRCASCKTVSVLPPAVWRVASRDTLSLYRAWVLFEGPSRHRESLVRQVRRRAETPPAREAPSAPPEAGARTTADDARRAFASAFDELGAEQARRARLRRTLVLAFWVFFFVVAAAALFGR